MNIQNLTKNNSVELLVTAADGIDNPTSATGEKLFGQSIIDKT